MSVIVDYAMCEYCSREISNALENNIPINQVLVKNFIISTSVLAKNHKKGGPEFYYLQSFLKAYYAYGNYPKEFDFGAFTGALTFYKAFMELK